MPVDQAFRKIRRVMLAEALRAGTAMPYPEWMFIPVEMSHSPSSTEEAQPSQRATKLPVGLLEKWSVLGAQS